jgi:hypothetical protein
VLQSAAAPILRLNLSSIYRSTFETCSLQSSPDWLKVPAWHLQAADPENFVHCRWVAVASYNVGYGSTPVFFDTDCAIPASLQLAGRQQQQQGSTLSSMDSSGLSALSALSALSGYQDFLPCHR